MHIVIVRPYIDRIAVLRFAEAICCMAHLAQKYTKLSQGYCRMTCLLNEDRTMIYSNGYLNRPLFNAPKCNFVLFEDVDTAFNSRVGH
jgi:hypothetical protein